MEDSNGSVIISNKQFEQLLDRITNSNVNQSVKVNPGALGLGAFALTTFILSLFNDGQYFIDIKYEPLVLPVALFYGGLAQFLAGIWQFKINNTFGATSFTSYGAFWMSFAAYVHFILPQLKQIGHANKATGLFLLAWLIFTLIMNVAAYKVSQFLFLLFPILSITFLFLTIGNLTHFTLLINIGGWCGIITAFIPCYASAAIIINSTFQKYILPLGLYN